MENIQVTHNNDNHHYRIAMDIAKEGSSLWDLTPYVKGRVGDNRFGLQVTWTYQGQLMNVEGMKPYIEGNVGQYSVDDQNNLQLDPNSGVVRYVGDPADCQAGGQATYYFPEQMFPKEGIFKGYVGLLDDRDDSKNPHISGVTVWFKVLPGIAEMGHACDYYISDLEKAEEIFKAKLRQHEADFQNETNKVISDARNSYTTEVANAHDALLALVSQIQANRDEQANLSQHLAGTEQQIETHDVVTRPEFLDLGNRLNQQVANLRQNKTLYFQDLTELQAQYPNGTDNLCVTLDDKHLHVYDYANNQWTDAGATDVITADPATKDAIYQDSSNVAPDPDFNLVDGNWYFGRDFGAPDWAFQPNKLDKSNVVKMNGYYNQSNQGNWNNSWCMSKNVNVNGYNVISIGWMINAKYGNQPDDADVHLELIFFDKNKAQLATWKYTVPQSNDDQLHLFSWNRIYGWPANTYYIASSVVVHGNGTAIFAQPRFSLANHTLPYNNREVEDLINYNDQHRQLVNATPDKNNLIPNPELINLDLWNFGSDQDKSRIEKQQKTYNNSNVYRIYGHNPSGNGDYGNAWLISSNFPVSGHAISVGALLSIHLDDPSAGYVTMGIKYYRADGSKSAPDYSTNIGTNTLDTELQRYCWENKLIPNDDTTTIQFFLQIHGAGYVDVADPIATLDKTISDSRKVMFFQRKNHEATDIWTLGKDLGGQVPIKVDHEAKTFAFDGFHSEQTKNNSNNTWLTANKIFFDNYDYYCVSFDWNLKVDSKSQDNSIRLEFYAHDGDSSQVVYKSTRTFDINDFTKGFAHLYWDGLWLPKGCHNFGVALVLHEKGTVTIADFNYKFNELYQDHGLPTMFINQSSAVVENDAKWSKANFAFKDHKRLIQGYLQIGVQGDSSKNYPKKNYKIKLFKDSDCKDKLKIQPQADWDSNSKFNLKANWIDATQARNLVNAQLVKDATAITPMAKPELTNNLLQTQSLGQMEGFPIEIFFQDGYHGLYTFNIKKDDKVFGMDSDNTKHDVISSEVSDHEFYNSDATIDGSNYATEIHDDVDPTVKSNFEKLIKFISNSNDSEFASNLANYIDVKSIMNTMLFGMMAHEWDYCTKSFLLCTWNQGAYWYMVPYDLDSTWGLFWDGSRVEKEGQDAGFGFKPNAQDTTAMKWITAQDHNNLFNRIYNLFKPQLKEQYDFLRNQVWSNSQIVNKFKQFIAQIPVDAYRQDQKTWPDIPSINTTNFDQLQQMTILRCNDMDEFMKHFTDPTYADKTSVTVKNNVSSPLGTRPNSADLIANMSELPTGTKVNWAKYPADAVGLQNGQITVSYPDGSYKKIDVSVTYTTQATPPTN